MWHQSHVVKSIGFLVLHYIYYTVFVIAYLGLLLCTGRVTDRSERKVGLIRTCFNYISVYVNIKEYKY